MKLKRIIPQAHIFPELKTFNVVAAAISGRSKMKQSQLRWKMPNRWPFSQICG
jgi:hypothetical protein